MICDRLGVQQVWGSQTSWQAGRASRPDKGVGWLGTYCACGQLSLLCHLGSQQTLGPHQHGLPGAHLLEREAGNG